MANLQGYRQWVMLVLALAGPLVVAAVIEPFRSQFAGSAAALIFIAVIVALSVVGNRVVGFVATLSSVVWFDFFLTRPYERLAISHRPDLETAICLLVVGLMVTELAARTLHYSRVSNEESEFISEVQRLSEFANGPATGDEVISRAIPSLVWLLGLRECHFDVDLVDPPLARIGPRGEVVHVGLQWPVDQMGIPGPEAEIVVQWRGYRLGRFVLTPTPGEPISRERRVVAVLVANVVAATLANQQRTA
ncbi:MAG: DUF4118 domain-containing protein [Acidimicrobiales bacterium]